MKKLLFLYFLISGTYSFSQDTIYYDKDWKETSNRAIAKGFKVTERNPDNPDAGYKRSFWISGQIKIEEYFTSFKKQTREGKRKMWREDGSLWRESNFKNNKLDGLVLSYWEDGQMKRKDIYRKGKLKEGTVWDIAGNEVEWYPLEQRPEFPGGEKAMIKYIKNNTEKPDGVAGGRVLVGFVIDVDGSITDIRIENSTSPALNLAAYNTVANMPHWQPGKQDGEAVRVKFTLPLNFR